MLAAATALRGGSDLLRCHKACCVRPGLLSGCSHPRRRSALPAHRRHRCHFIAIRLAFHSARFAVRHHRMIVRFVQRMAFEVCLCPSSMVRVDAVGFAFLLDFDIAYLRCLPNIVLMAPRDEAMLVHMLRTALIYEGGPMALRYPRGEAIGVPLPAEPAAITIGTGEILREAGSSGEPAGGAARVRQRRRQGARRRRSWPSTESP